MVFLFLLKNSNSCDLITINKLYHPNVSPSYSFSIVKSQYLLWYSWQGQLWCHTGWLLITFKILQKYNQVKQLGKCGKKTQCFVKKKKQSAKMLFFACTCSNIYFKFINKSNKQANNPTMEGLKNSSTNQDTVAIFQSQAFINKPNFFAEPI